MHGMGYARFNKGIHNFCAENFPYCIFPLLNLKLNKLNIRTVFVHLKGLGVPSCRRPPFLSSNKILKRKGGRKMNKEYFLFVNGKKIKVSEEIYKVYWQEKNHEDYLKQIDLKNHLLLFSSFDHDGHFEYSIVDEGFDVDKIVQTQMMIEAVRDAISQLNDEEREIIDRFYFNDETIRSVAETKKISHLALINRRNKILDKLIEMLKDFR